MKLGNETLTAKDFSKLKKRGGVSILAHPASVNKELLHSCTLLHQKLGKSFISAFGPQHGIFGEKQDNMIESEDFRDTKLGIPVYSLYGKSRKPTPQSLEAVKILLVDLQDIGTRVYTFITSLFYIMEAFHNSDKELWILDRPNPAGRSIEGLRLEKDLRSFVGCAEGLIHRHGMTVGELAHYFKKNHKLNVNLKIVKMSGYKSHTRTGWGWPVGELPWVNPSPNVPRLSSTRCFAGTVLIEACTLSEGRGTTRPLEVMGAPDVDSERILKEMEKTNPKWLEGCLLRTGYFEPTFHKHAGKICSALQIHVDQNNYNPNKFKPMRLVCLYLKSLKKLYPEYNLWRNDPYEYESEKKAIDLICGSSYVRKWIDESKSKCLDLENEFQKSEREWKKIQKEFSLYKY